MSSDLVMERFRLGERIGAGGMGVVYRAFDERLQRDVAVKEVAADDPERVLREAQAAARLNHPAIVTLYEMGTEGPRAYLVSELVDGLTVREAARSGALSDRDVAEIGADLCDALEHAHAQGVVHRDIKPQNVAVPDADEVTGSARAKLMDFGTASLAEGPSLTATGEVVGTIAYMSPEQAAGARAGAPSDVYSLALTLYECWAGRNPVVRDSPAATARAIGGRLESLRDARPELPPPLCEAIDACLAPDPETRPQLGELGETLRDAAPALDDREPVPCPGSPGEWDASSLAGDVARRLAAPLTAALLVAWFAIDGRPDAAGVVAGVFALVWLWRGRHLAAG